MERHDGGSNGRSSMAPDGPPGRPVAAPVDTLDVVFDPELRLHLPRTRRADPVQVRTAATVTIGHVVQSLGVPLTEVGVLELDGVGVDPGTRAVGRRLVVTPVPHPQPVPTWPPRFVLDVHLGALARRLRLVGLDVAYERDADDDSLAAQALAGDRVLLTRDRELLRRRVLSVPPRHGAFVHATAADEQMLEVLRRFAPPLAPWTRCLRCGARLEPAAKAELAHLLPAGTRRTYEEFARCTGCGRPFWRGAHGAGLEAVVRRAEEAVRHM
ncbi:Mut7-C ubiquitin/RNAse domain-containing protein [Georgenia yuyongxinii]|nr:Mut7-C ubiquitin/RNAse domain-containing protein [Georgenia yuyongxinii]